MEADMEILQNFINENYSIKKENLEMNIEQIDGMTNHNYHIIFNDKNTPDKKHNILFRKYGEILDPSSHSSELSIMNFYSNKNEGPKLLYTSNQYRIDEYISNHQIIPLEFRYEPDVLNDINQKLAEYGLISNIYKYSISRDLNIEKKVYISNNQNNFDTIFELSDKMYHKAIDKFNEFKAKFNDYIAKNPTKCDEDTKKRVEKFKQYLTDYKKKFVELFPKEGFLILCHNDCQRWNFLFKSITSKLLIIDHEYACLAIPGLDLCNYMNENSYYFLDNGKYEFRKEEIEFDFYYNFYLDYYTKFVELNKDWVTKDENKEFLELIKSKNYYLNLHSITNVFWFLFCAINLEFDEEIINKNSHYLEYGADRLAYSEYAQSLIKAAN